MTRFNVLHENVELKSVLQSEYIVLLNDNLVQHYVHTA